MRFRPYMQYGSVAAMGGVTPIFSLPLSDLGAGAVSTTPDTAGGSPTATFTRATTAWTKLSTGLWAQVASGQARSCYLGQDTTVGAYGGYLAEGARTNSCLWARDLTNAAWTATNVTTAKTATGIDGSANSASTLTAIAGNGTVTQALTIASAAKTFGVFVRRKTGTGTVQISLDNFATNTDITALINSTTYTLVQKTQTLANPTVGFKLVTNADAIEVDMCQLEDGASFASSPIPTTTVAVTRNADVLTYATSGNISSLTGTFYTEFTTAVPASNSQNIGILSSNTGGTEGIPLYIRTAAGNKFTIYDGTTEIQIGAAQSPPFSSTTKVAVTWSGVTTSVAKSGAILGTDTTSFDGNLNLGANMIFGSEFVANNVTAIYGTIRNARIYGSALTAAQLQAMTT